MNLKNKTVLVIGLAVTGIPLVKTLLKLGADVIVNDLRSEKDLKDSLKQLEAHEFQHILGKHPEDIDQLGEIDLVVVSPGVPLEIPFIKALRERDLEIIGEIELAYRFNKAPIVAITGTNGKTTTTALTGEIFKNASKNTFVVGNIGVAAISKALETTSEDVVVMEISSFQLESTVDFHPKAAAILNLTPDHLNRHKTMENYIKAKFNIFENQNANDYAVINHDDELCRSHSENLKAQKIYFSRKHLLNQGVFVEDNNIVILHNKKRHRVMAIKDIKMLGNHNLENALAATAMAFVMGISPENIAETLKTFQGVEHRMEHVITIKEIDFVNDSKGTNVDAAIKAIEAIDTPIILLAGGQDKGSEFHDFIQAFHGKVKHVFAYGETAGTIYETAKKMSYDNVNIVEDLEKAVIEAYTIAKAKDTILLSPACASWDMYKNFEERGNHFKNIVLSLRGV
ncbi:MAG: UDP-N-acetylmuramoyl-L-alanine--D-glutamate ligase [Clostridiaceae bacterium]|nr:UDP-N-acetylmuramoyl-L-alanine--D-glutamate ligase [Clostridiaceae bacterium]